MQEKPIIELEKEYFFIEYKGLGLFGAKTEREKRFLFELYELEYTSISSKPRQKLLDHKKCTYDISDKTEITYVAQWMRDQSRLVEGSDFRESDEKTVVSTLEQICHKIYGPEKKTMTPVYAGNGFSNEQSRDNFRKVWRIVFRDNLTPDQAARRLGYDDHDW